MSQWAEVRQMHLVDKRPRKEIARRLGLDVKTVRRALASSEPPGERRSPERDRTLDVHRARIEALLKADPALSAKRIRKVLLGEVKPKPVLPPRTVRHYVAWLRGTLFAKEAFVHRTHAFGDTMEVDFFEAWATIGACCTRCGSSRRRCRRATRTSRRPTSSSGSSVCSTGSRRRSGTSAGFRGGSCSTTRRSPCAGC